MKERDFEIVTPDDEIFENLNDLGAFRTGGKRTKKFKMITAKEHLTLKKTYGVKFNVLERKFLLQKILWLFMLI